MRSGYKITADDDDPIVVTEQSVARKLREVSTSRASCPDNIPNWVLRKYSDISAVPIADILNASFSEVSVPRVWKLADVPPLLKAPIVSDFNKDHGFLVSKETVVLRRWERSKQKFGFIKRVDELIKVES